MSKTSPTAPIGRLRQWKIALSLAVVGALAAPFAFGTYKARPPVPLTAQEKEERANYLSSHGNHCEGIPDEILCLSVMAELESGTTSSESHYDLPKYWMMNVGVAAGTAVSIFGLAYLIPMLIRGVAFLARRYWGWLNA